MSDVTRRLLAGLSGVLGALVVLTLVAATGGTRAGLPLAAAADRQTVPGAVLPAPAPAVLPNVATSAAAPSAGVLTGLIRPLLASKALGSSASADVLDPQTGQHLVAIGQSRILTPASTAKLLTATAALSLLGPQSTLTTRAVTGGSPEEVVLVGGGDVLLASGRGDPATVRGRAGLDDLAAATAASLRARGITRVTLRVDDTLFTGPAVSPAWKGTDVGHGYVAPIHAIEVDEGWQRADRRTVRATDPALAAARQFAALLVRRGIAVSGDVARATAPAHAPTLGDVRSASIGDLVEYALTQSDNTLAEALARLVAAGSNRPATFTGAGEAVIAQVASLGVPVTGAHLADGSGLSAGSGLSPAILTSVLALAASSEHPELRPLLTGLPVAGVSGTLSDRFDQRSQRGAAGVVRAKTGTLSGVSSLAGTLVDADGRLLVFAVMADQVGATEPARRALDTVVSTLVRCGCR